MYVLSKSKNHIQSENIKLVFRLQKLKINFQIIFQSWRQKGLNLYEFLRFIKKKLIKKFFIQLRALLSVKNFKNCGFRILLEY